jgi:hypothetical protein
MTRQRGRRDEFQHGSRVDNFPAPGSPLPTRLRKVRSGFTIGRGADLATDPPCNTRRGADLVRSALHHAGRIHVSGDAIPTRHIRPERPRHSLSGGGCRPLGRLLYRAPRVHPSAPAASGVCQHLAGRHSPSAQWAWRLGLASDARWTAATARRLEQSRAEGGEPSRLHRGVEDNERSFSQ